MASGGKRIGSGRKKGAPAYSNAAAERVRERIATGMLVTRLTGYADGTLPIADSAVEAVRLRAGEILLRKVLPDLDRTELTGAAGGPLVIVTRME